MGSNVRFTRVGSDSTWPQHDSLDDLEWRLRHAGDSLTDGDLVVAASVLSAYGALVRAGSKRRNQVIKALREATGRPEGKP